MNCPKCNHILPDNISNKINFCPFCGGKLFEDDKDFMIEITCTGQRNLAGGVIMLFLDDTTLYEIQPGENIYITVRAGFHTMKKNIPMVVVSTAPGCSRPPKGRTIVK